MSIHDFYSKLMSGKEEGRLFDALRRLREIGSPALMAEEEPANWNVWMDGTSSAEPGWTVWQEDPGASMISAQV
jgi:hypothetical protein